MKVDIDDKVFHYLMWFGGMLAMSLIHGIMDALGLNVIKGWKKLFRKKTR